MSRFWLLDEPCEDIVVLSRGIIIETKLEEKNRDHLGKIITLCCGPIKPGDIVWGGSMRGMSISRLLLG